MRPRHYRGRKLIAIPGSKKTTLKIPVAKPGAREVVSTQWLARELQKFLRGRRVTPLEDMREFYLSCLLLRHELDGPISPRVRRETDALQDFLRSAQKLA